MSHRRSSWAELYQTPELKLSGHHLVVRMDGRRGVLEFLLIRPGWRVRGVSLPRLGRIGALEPRRHIRVSPSDAGTVSRLDRTVRRPIARPVRYSPTQLREGAKKEGI